MYYLPTNTAGNVADSRLLTNGQNGGVAELRILRYIKNILYKIIYQNCRQLIVKWLF